ncbi:chaplin [Streptomyces albipurpureus]|uniref:Chaplin n=1 Tax=Streptomyces albipurpureus TaxID=2897419 RepID=A0ABT0UQM6_9ACTN|nr:chaplin [Streptomyces sp. CWNU-1]MCM2390828.1 chaplin [Streptomyces sp. CWNU-1]
MRQIHRKGLATVMLTGGALALAGHASADSIANGGAVGSPGVIAGNTVQLPIHVPLNLCGNTVNVVGLLNPAAGNSCANTSKGGATAPGGQTPGSQNSGGSVANGITKGSPGVISGNGVQLPVDLPVNLSGNSLNVVGIGNPAFGNTSVNGPAEPTGPKPPPPVKPVTPPVTPPITTPKPPPTQKPVDRPVERPNTPDTPDDTKPRGALAHTGAGGIGYVVPAGAALMLGGALLYRRARRAEA